MVVGVTLFVFGGCLFLLGVQQIIALWQQGCSRPRSASRQPGPAPSAAWTPFVVHPETARDDIKHQYHALARRYHPDHGGDARLMAAINERFAELMRRYPA